MTINPNLLIIGYTNIDINIAPNGKETILPGGAAYFASLGASLVTKNVGLVTRIGKDFDASFLLERVRPEGVKIVHNKKTARSIQTYHSYEDPTDRDVLLEHGVAQDMVPEDIPNQWIQSARYIHVATMPPQYQKLFIDYLCSQNIKAFLSTDVELSFLKESSLQKIIFSNLNKCDLIFANRNEYSIIKNHVTNIPHVVVKQDKDGAVLLKKNIETVNVPTKQVFPKDPTGAGDMFAGVFLACLTEGKSFEDSLHIAAKIATQSVEKEGVRHLFTTSLI